MNRKRQHIIIDACVARAAGSSKENPKSPSRECVECFEAIDAAGLHVLMNRELRDEWSSHKGSYASEWLNNKIARRRFRAVSDDWFERDGFNAVTETLPDRKRQELVKDSHLVSLSYIHRAPVLTLEDKLLELLCTIRPAFNTIDNTEWANPVNPETVMWIHAGIPVRPEFSLIGICRARKKRGKSAS